MIPCSKTLQISVWRVLFRCIWVPVQARSWAGKSLVFTRAPPGVSVSVPSLSLLRVSFHARSSARGTAVTRRPHVRASSLTQQTDACLCPCGQNYGLSLKDVRLPGLLHALRLPLLGSFFENLEPGWVGWNDLSNQGRAPGLPVPTKPHSRQGLSPGWVLT